MFVKLLNLKLFFFEQRFRVLLLAFESWKQKNFKLNSLKLLKHILVSFVRYLQRSTQIVTIMSRVHFNFFSFFKFWLNHILLLLALCKKCFCHFFVFFYLFFLTTLSQSCQSKFEAFYMTKNIPSYLDFLLSNVSRTFTS